MTTTYAFMDPGSNVSFCALSLMYKLEIQGKQMKLTMDTMGYPHTVVTYQLQGLRL